VVKTVSPRCLKASVGAGAFATAKVEERQTIQAKNSTISLETAPLTSDVPKAVIRGPGNRKAAAK
jgi:hypothetical protein